MKKNLPLLVGVLLVITLGGLYIWGRIKPRAEIHYHAGFKVFVDGQLQDFSDPKYMSLIPCNDAHDVQTDPQVEQLEKAHLHDGVGTVVHAHREGAKWGDLFQNMGFTFDGQKPLRAFIGSEEVSNILAKKIEPYESVIILVGSFDSNKNYFTEAVSKSEIEAEERKSESCGK